MNILVLSFYYYPDLSAGSFRTSSLVEAMSKKLTKNDSIDVITTLPNRYATYGSEAEAYEKTGNITIRRIKLSEHSSGMIDQSKAFFFFAKRALSLIKDRKYDLVYATSSRLMTATLGVYIANKMRSKIYLDVRDIFVDTIADVLPRKLSMICKPFFKLAEKYTFRHPDKINLVSKGFEKYFSHYYSGSQYSFFTNGIDREFITDSDFTKNSPDSSNPVIVLYAGNIGEGQGLHSIIPSLAKNIEGNVVFKIIGDGGRKRTLEENLKRLDIDNVEIFPPVSRKELMKAYKEADVLFLHLNSFNAFKKVLPSKIFEYAATGKPIWAGVSGYAAEFLKSEVSNAAVFEPCDENQAQLAFNALDLSTTSRLKFIDKYKRSNIMKLMADDVLSVIKV